MSTSWAQEEARLPSAHGRGPLPSWNGRFETAPPGNGSVVDRRGGHGHRHPARRADLILCDALQRAPDSRNQPGCASSSAVLSDSGSTRGAAERPAPPVSSQTARAVPARKGNGPAAPQPSCQGDIKHSSPVGLQGPGPFPKVTGAPFVLNASAASRILFADHRSDPSKCRGPGPALPRAEGNPVSSHLSDTNTLHKPAGAQSTGSQRTRKVGRGQAPGGTWLHLGGGAIENLRPEPDPPSLFSAKEPKILTSLSRWTRATLLCARVGVTPSSPGP